MSVTSIFIKTMVIIICSLGFTLIAPAQNVFIPDSIFKAALTGNANINTNGDGEIQMSEAAVYSGWIDVPGLNIADLTGIEAFPLIPYLDCRNNNLSALNVTSNTVLTRLYCGGNSITALDVSANTALTDLLCEINALTSLDISTNTALIKLSCFSNQISSLDVSANTVLEQLYCGNNLLTALDVSADTALTALSFSENQLTSIDVSNNTALVYFYSAINYLTNVDLTNHNFLLVADCGYNLIDSLDITGDTSLAYLFCSGNQLTTLNLLPHFNLNTLWCNNNLLTTLNLSANPVFVSLLCDSNQLTSLNVQNGNNTSVTNFIANGNPNLFCIQVDDAAYSTANWHVVDPWSSFNNSCFTTLSEDANEVHLSLYPNPFNNQLILNIPDKDLGARFAIHDATGKIIMEKDANESMLTVNTENFAGGLYLVRLINKKGVVICRKVVKE